MKHVFSVSGDIQKLFNYLFGHIERHIMKRIVTIMIIIAATVATAAVVLFWALRPLGFASYLYSTELTDADIIRQQWPHRLVEPEWIRATSDRMDRLMNWHIYETAARLFVIVLLWFLIGGGAVYKFIRGRKLGPNLANSSDAKSPQLISAVGQQKESDGK